MVPTATYRLQLHAGFTFDDAIAIVSYLRDLGVSHVYCSPYLQAVEGSTHGYDVVDHNRVNEELGGAAAHREFSRELRRLRLAQVLDIVPNHMAIGTRDNAWWWDVLENGPSSRYAHFFDVEWDPPEKRLQNLVLVPVLGDHYGRILEAGEIVVRRNRGKFELCYHDHVLPVAPKSLPQILGPAARMSGSDELAFISDGFDALALATVTDAATVSRRHRDKEILRRQLEDLASGEPEVAAAIDHRVAEINADHDLLDILLGAQNFRIAYWRTAGRELGYRRFFDINTLVGLRMEDERVFLETHRLVLQWLRTGVIDGVRVDHPDGLRNPEEYFTRLRAAAPRAWIVAEKILEPGERLRTNWGIDGTTGYDFLYRAGGLFVDSRAEEVLTRVYGDFTGRSTDYPRAVRKRKDQILRETLGSDVNRLTAMFLQVCDRHRRYRDFTRHEIHHAIREIIVSFPVYRTYVRSYEGQISADDVRYIDEAVDDAKRRRSDVASDLFDFIRSVLLLETRGDIESEFVMRFQQLTGPAMAKGVEDTTFYVYNRLSSLNEVGGSPGKFGVTPEEFHALNQEAAERWPNAMLATSTHDTKRSEDVRCRLHVLSEMPEEWSAAVSEWAAHNSRYRQGEFPDRNIEYLLYQTLIGAWPIEHDRLATYLAKASREAKMHTSWTDPNPGYDEALRQFVRSVYDDREFMCSLGQFAQRLIEPGRINSLAQTLLKLTCPGVPDTYQGTEVWDLSLVDPDNRRPIDYDKRRQLLSEVQHMTVDQVMARMDDGLPKLWLTHRTLALRRERPEWFTKASYEPVYARGPKAHHTVAYLRAGCLLVLVPRLVMTLGGEWDETVIDLSKQGWVNVLTGETMAGGETRIADLLRRFPVALLRLG
jgi:(1->4)-alpha-D-glucan 1-alpha-D-glucosylmutase